jgi:methionyl-tRNA formyltransferase
MITEVNRLCSDQQTLPTTQPETGVVSSEAILDNVRQSPVYDGTLHFIVQVTNTPAGGTSIQAKVQTSPDNSAWTDVADTGAVTLAKALALMNRNALPPAVPQNPVEATYARKFKKTDGLIDWTEPVLVIERKIRAYSPWPGSYTFLPARFRRKGNSGRVVVASAEIVSVLDDGWKDAAPGTVLQTIVSVPKDARRDASGREVRTGIVVKCGDTALKLTMLKPEGGSLMDGAAFLAGRPLAPLADSFSRE